MTARALALMLGVAYTGLGVLGFLPGGLAGLLPASAALGAVHLALGCWGLAAYAGRVSMPAYLVGAAFVFAILAVGGMLEGVNHGALVWAHLVSGALAGFVAWRPRSGERRGLAGDRRRVDFRVESERRRGAYDRRRAPAAAIT